MFYDVFFFFCKDSANEGRKANLFDLIPSAVSCKYTYFSIDNKKHLSHICRKKAPLTHIFVKGAKV